MNPPRAGRSGEAGERIYRCFLYLLPQSLREEFGEEMVALFRDRLAEAKGPMGWLLVWSRGILDIASQAVGERWWGRPRRHGGARGRRIMRGSFLQDLRFGTRMLARYPGFTVLAVLTLAVGIGGVTLIFTLVNGVLLRPLPYPHPEQLVMLQELSEKGSRLTVSYPNLVDWRERSRSFQSMTGGYPVYTPTVRGLGDPFQVRSMGVAQGFFRTVGVLPVLGRPIADEENRPGGPGVAVVSHEFWETRLGSNRHLEDLTFQLGSSVAQVVGVMPAGFHFLADVDVWVPFENNPVNIRNAHNHWVVGRLAPGVTMDRARAEMNRIAADLKREYGKSEGAAAVDIRPLRTVVVGDVRRPLGLLLGAAALVLLLASSNVAGMLLARGKLRETELAMRLALGAGRGRLVAQLLTEGVVLATVAGLGGLLLSLAGLHFVKLAGSSMIPRLSEVSMNGTVLLFTLAAALATVLLSIVPPALSASRHVQGTVRSGRRAGRARSRMWRLLMGTEVALAVVLLVGAGLLVRSLEAIFTADTGYDRRGVMTVNFSMPGDLYPDPAARLQFLERLRPRLSALPGVTTVGLANDLPMEAGARTGPVRIPPNLSVEDPAAWKAIAGWRVVDGDYFRALGIALVRGRLFGSGDVEGAANVAIVNTSLAQRLWPGENPLGRQLRANWDYRNEDFTVVGVVGEARSWSKDPGRQPELYVPYAERPEHTYSMYAVLRTTGNPAALIAPARRVLKELDPQLYATFSTIDQAVTRSTADRRFTAAIMGGMAAISLLLAFVGIFGVVSQTVASRVHEIGIRLAVGGTPFQVVRLLEIQSLRWVLVGGLVGVLGALAATSWLRSLLYGVDRYDGLTFVTALVAVFAAAFLASLIPVLRLTRVDPVTTLRAE